MNEWYKYIFVYLENHYLTNKEYVAECLVFNFSLSGCDLVHLSGNNE